MNNIGKILILILIFLAGSCSSMSTSENSASFATVEIDSVDSNEKVQPLIKKKNQVQITNNIENSQITKIVGVVFGPGMNRVVGYIPMLKHIKKSKINFHVAMGTGLGAVIAAYSALGTSHNKIEWDFLQLVKSLEGKIPYSDEWVEIVDNKILKKFKGKKIESLNKLLVIPLYDTKKEEITYFYKGDLYLILKYNLRLNVNNESKYISAIKSDPFSITRVNRFGVDNWFGFDVLGNNITFDQAGDGYIVGVLGKVISSKKKQLDKYSGFYELPMSKMSLDSVNNIPRFMKYADKEAQYIAIQIKDLLKK